MGWNGLYIKLNSLFLLRQSTAMNIDHAIDTRNDVALLGADQCDDTVLVLETVHRWLCHVPLGIVRVEFDVEIDCVV